MSKSNAIEFLKNIKWHCVHEEPDADFIHGTIDLALKELETTEALFPMAIYSHQKKSVDSK